MKTIQPEDGIFALNQCLVEALVTNTSMQIHEETANSQEAKKTINRQKITKLIDQLKISQNVNTIHGIAYRVGQSFFYNFLYTFDKQYNFSDLSFKLLPFEQKRTSFLSSFAQQLKNSKINCEWNQSQNTLTYQTDFPYNSVVQWFIKGLFAEMLFWLSNGKQDQIKIDQSDKNCYQISIN